MTVETGSSDIEFLLADSYVGKPWPVTDDFHPDLKALENGSWLVLIVRSDCKHCRELLERYFSDPAVRPDDARTAIFVAGSSSWPFQFDRVTVPVTSGEFVQWDSQEPFVAGPAVFLLSDGIVVAAADGQNSDAFVRKLIKH